jgi:hypothetical protein
MMLRGRRGRSARARGLRTLQHQALPAETRHAIDTEVWFRTLVTGHPGSADSRWATKDQVHDEAIASFLQRHRRQPYDHYAKRREGAEDVTFWLDSKLMQRARRMAERDGVKLAHLIEAALSSYVKRYVPADLLAFRHWVQQEARRIYGTASAAASRAAFAHKRSHRSQSESPQPRRTQAQRGRLKRAGAQRAQSQSARSQPGELVRQAPARRLSSARRS